MTKKSSGSYRRDAQHRENGDGTGSKIVRREFDPANPPAFTDKMKAEIEALQAMSDEDIDLSDIPELDEKFWKNAVSNPYFRPVKQQLTLRIDADVIAWFKRRALNGRGYQSDINKALREFVSQQEKKAG